MKVKLSWVLTTLVNFDISKTQKQNFFNLEEVVGFYNNLNIDPSKTIVPIQLKQTTSFNQLFNKKILINNPKFNVKKKFPTPFYFEKINQSCSLNITLHIYPPNILSINVSLSSYDIDSISEIQDIVKIKENQELFEIIKTTINIVNYAFTREATSKEKITATPIIEISECTNNLNFDEFFNTNKKVIVETLIRSKLENIENVENIINKNDDINFKKDSNYILLDKQGLMFLDKGNVDSQYNRKVKKFYELGIVHQTFMRNFTKTYSLNKNFSDFLMSRIIHFINDIESIFCDSVSVKHIWNLISTEFSLFQLYENLGIQNQERIKSNERVFEIVQNEWFKNMTSFTYLLDKTIQEQIPKQKKKRNIKSIISILVAVATFIIYVYTTFFMKKEESPTQEIQLKENNDSINQNMINKNNDSILLIQN